MDRGGMEQHAFHAERPFLGLAVAVTKCEGGSDMELGMNQS